MSQRENRNALVLGTAAATLASLAIAGILVGIILTLALTKGTILPVSDEARLGPIAQKLHSGSLTFGDLWAPNNEHRILPSKIIGATIIHFTEWNRVGHLLVALGLVAMSAAFFLRAAWLTIAWKPAALVCGPVFLALSFSLTRYGNWGVPYTDKIPTVLGIAISTWALAQPPGRSHLVLAATGATIASVSSLGGFMVWVAFVPVILASWGRRFLLWWMLTAVVLAGIYFVDYTPQSGNPPVDAVPLPFARRVTSLLAYLGAPIGGEPFLLNVAVGLASVLVAGAVYAALAPIVRVNSSLIRPVLLWTGVASFAMGTGIAIIAGRATAFGEGVSTESRFHAFSSLWLMALTALTALLISVIKVEVPDRLQGSKTLRFGASGAAICLLVLLSVGFVHANVTARHSAITFLDYYQQGEGCAINPVPASEACLRVFMYSEPEAERETLSYLQANLKGVYANPINVSVSGTPPALPLNELGPKASIFSCSSDARRRPPGEFSDSLITAACQRVMGSRWPTQPLTLDPLNNRRLCLVDDWGRWGKRLEIDSTSWCAVEWFDPDLQAVSLVHLDSNVVLHAFPNGTVRPYVDGETVRRTKARS